MRRIYTNAKLVAVWLGEAADDSNSAVHFIRNHSSISRDSPGDKYSRIQLAIGSLFARPYWNRLWIIQELKLARSIIFFCGGRDIAGSEMQDYINSFKRTPRIPEYQDKYFLSPVSRRILAGETFQYQRVSHTAADPRGPYADPILLQTDDNERIPAVRFLRRVYLYCSHQCADPRDKIFGLLGLTSDTEDIIPVDYNKTVADLAEAVLRVSSSVIPVHRIEPEGLAYHFYIHELIDGWTHFFARLLLAMDVATEAVLERTAAELEKVFESFQEKRIATGRCWPERSNGNDAGCMY